MRRLAVLCLFAAAVPGQRAECTGTLRDPDGRPIARATVTFCQDPSQRLGGEPDRVEVRTGDAGTFSAALLPGCFYAVWAVGPAGDDGARWVTGVALDAAAGRGIELAAERRARPHRVAVSGVAGWKRALPPALRTLLGGVFPFGHDVPLARDGTLTLGPWPGHDAVLALVDDKRQVVCQTAMVHAAISEVGFPAARTLEITAVDERDRPLADATVAVLDEWAARRSGSFAAPHPVPGPGPGSQPWRVAGRTDREGRCIVSIPWARHRSDRDVTVAVSKAGHAVEFVGVESGKAIVTETTWREPEAFRVPVATAPPRRVRVVGHQPRGAILAAVERSFEFRHAGGGGQRLYRTRTAIEGNDGAVLALTAPLQTQCFVRLAPAVGPPPRVCFATDWQGPIDLDFAKLTRRTIRVVDTAGAPVPFAHVALAHRHGSDRVFARVHDRCVAGPGGDLEAWLTDDTWDVVVVSGTRYASYRVAPNDDPVVTIELAPAPVARIRVVDEAGAPVAGARLGDHAGWRGEPDDWFLRMFGRSWARAARSDSAGLLTVPLLASELFEVRVVRGGQRSWRTRVRPGTRELRVTLR